MRSRITPSEVREQDFPERWRGLDPEQVHRFLDRLADDYADALADLEVAREEAGMLQQRLADLSAQRHEAPPAVPSSTRVLVQAQRVSESLIEDAVRRAGELLAEARAQAREIREHSLGALTGADIEYVRTFAQVARREIDEAMSALGVQADHLDRLARLDRDSLLARARSAQPE